MTERLCRGCDQPVKNPMDWWRIRGSKFEPMTMLFDAGFSAYRCEECAISYNEEVDNMGIAELQEKGLVSL